jgi:hypothetical protein
MHPIASLVISYANNYDSYKKKETHCFRAPAMYMPKLNLRYSILLNQVAMT